MNKTHRAFFGAAVLQWTMILCAGLLLTGNIHAEQAISVSQWGITWTFDKPATVGKFVTGDWWVLGPVTVVKVDPATNDGRNGSMVNPKSAHSTEFTQAYDNRVAAIASADLGAKVYNAKLSISFPLAFKPGQSLVSTRSEEKIHTDANKLTYADLPPPPECIDAYYFRYPIISAAVLTCLDKVPPADAFRPSYVDAPKTIYTVSQIRRDALPHLPVPAGAIAPDYDNREKSLAMVKDAQQKLLDPAGRTSANAGRSLGAITNLCDMPSTAIQERLLQRLWLDYVGENVNGFHPSENMPGSPREITTIMTTTGLLLLLDDPKGEREQLLRHFLQKGIDYWGVAQSCNNTFVANGAIDSGRKWPVVFAGIMFGDKAMMGNNNAINAEDDQTYAGTGWRGQKALYRNVSGATYEELPPEKWKDGIYAKKASNGWRMEAYRTINSSTWVGEALAARLMGAKAAWNHDAWFDYVDRWIQEASYGHYVIPGLYDKGASSADFTAEDIAKIKPVKYNPWKSDFIRIMWQAYRDKTDKIGEETKAKWNKPVGK